MSRKDIIQQVEESLKRLKTNYIDLYQLHTYDPLTPIEETLRVLDDLVRSGKVRYIGANYFMAWHLMKALGHSTYNHLEKFASLQANFSLDNRDLEREMIPLLQDQKVGLMLWSPLSGGLLTGKYKRDGSNEKGRLNDFPFEPFHKERAFDVLDLLYPMAEQKGHSVAQLALAWLLHQPVVSSIIIVATKLPQLQDNLKAVDIEFTAQELQKLEEVSALSIEYLKNVVEVMVADRSSGQDFFIVIIENGK